MGPLYFDIGKNFIERLLPIAAYIFMWPALVPGRHMELPIGNVLLKRSLLLDLKRFH
ncbi:hypothetical protein POPTR_001G289250v4 [Populus trichocarpa]|uniref:Uncharacterized protein n=1 Tax=Populus trichocarpa TaxID=3694 RepID=A0ACC0TMY2_POPTR|nr:hypothetical protein POPTR_001G289250v4 [Populus trichocarpa]